MGLKVLIFIDEIRPDENLLGLMQISVNAEFLDVLEGINDFKKRSTDIAVFLDLWIQKILISKY
jgi:hypothetical protein